MTPIATSSRGRRMWKAIETRRQGTSSRFSLTRACALVSESRFWAAWAQHQAQVRIQDQFCGAQPNCHALPSIPCIQASPQGLSADPIDPCDRGSHCQLGSWDERRLASFQATASHRWINTQPGQGGVPLCKLCVEKAFICSHILHNRQCVVVVGQSLV